MEAFRFDQIQYFRLILSILFIVAFVPHAVLAIAVSLRDDTLKLTDRKRLQEKDKIKTM